MMHEFLTQNSLVAVNEICLEKTINMTLITQAFD